VQEDSTSSELWSSGDAYENYVGRWSRPVARQFLDWLTVDPAARWLDVGCGTGALTQTILATQAPASVTSIDPSDAFIAHARGATNDPRATFAVASAEATGVEAAAFDVVVSGLVFNFVRHQPQALREFRRVLLPDGVAAAYVWDYADGMQMMRRFWDAAIALDAAAEAFDEARLFSICDPNALARAWSEAGFGDVETRAIEVDTVFASFDDYWLPFLRGRAPAPAYAMSLSEEKRAELREHLRGRLPPDRDGRIRLIARAWAVKGKA
jgi:trans-aconitate methyltransferase